MMTPFKWIFVSILVVVFTLSIAYFSFVQNITTNTSTEIETLANTLQSGLMRSGLNDSGNNDETAGKFITNQESEHYNEDGYTGTLEAYIHSGEYTPEHTKFVTVETGSNQWTPVEETFEYALLVGTEETGGYDGILDLTYSGLTPDGRRELVYEGNVTKPAEDTRVYRYQGYVTKESGDGESIPFLNKEELVANLSSALVSVQKNHPFDIQLDYVFFDNGGNVTNEDSEMRSLQFRIAFVNDNGELKGSAERHLAIDQLAVDE